MVRARGSSVRSAPAPLSVEQIPHSGDIDERAWQLAPPRRDPTLASGVPASRTRSRATPRSPTSSRRSRGPAGVAASSRVKMFTLNVTPQATTRDSHRAKVTLYKRPEEMLRCGPAKAGGSLSSPSPLYNNALRVPVLKAPRRRRVTLLRAHSSSSSASSPAVKPSNPNCGRMSCGKPKSARGAAGLNLSPIK